MSRRLVFVVALVGLAAAAMGGTWWKAGRGASRNAAGAAARRDPNSLRSLVNQDGERFSFERLKGRTVVLNFIFTHCPSSCPMQTKALTTVQGALSDALRERVSFVSVSMDPERDTPSVLKQYATLLGARPSNWSFVTGSADEITWLGSHFSAQVTRIDAGQFNHRVAVYLLDANQRLVQTYSGEPLDQKRLLTEIEAVDRLFNQS